MPESGRKIKSAASSGWFKIERKFIFEWGPKLGPDRLAVLMALAAHADAEGVCWPSYDRLAKVSGVSRRGVIRAVADLAEMGLLHIEPGTGRRPNLYTVILRCDEAQNKAKEATAAPEWVWASSATWAPLDASSARLALQEEFRSSARLAPLDASSASLALLAPVAVPGWHPNENRKEREEDSSEPARPDSEPTTTKIVFQTKEGTWSLPPNLLANLQTAYPSLDCLAEALRARMWCETNPARRKTASGMPKFLAAWMARASRGPGPRQTQPQKETPEQIAAKLQADRKAAEEETERNRANSVNAPAWQELRRRRKNDV